MAAGQRVAGEINCNLDPEFSHPDATFVRSHAPKRCADSMECCSGHSAIANNNKQYHTLRTALLQITIHGMYHSLHFVLEHPA